MSKPPSPETLLKRERAAARKLNAQICEARAERDQYRARATRAEQECAEWKARFDALLRRDTQVEVSGQPFTPTITV